MKKVQREDCQKVGKLDFIDWEKFRNTTILVTGSTGLIGSNLVNALAYNNQEKMLGIKLILPVRKVEAAERLFSWTDAEIIPYKLGEELKLETFVDYIIHLASPTSSKHFTEKPVDTMTANIEGTRMLLEWAKAHLTKQFVYLSTMEVYGFPKKGHKVKEDELGAFETMNVRNSYPIAKVACEAMCNGYCSQYHVPVVVLRATQTFGPGVKYDDGRVFAQFMRCVIEGKNIILKSEGLTERSYLYTSDAVSAILVGMIRGVSGEAYTVANPDTYCAIKDMAKMVADKIALGKIEVKFDIAKDITELGYAEVLHMKLNVKKIKKLGWKAEINLEEMFARMICGIGECNV